MRTRSAVEKRGREDSRWMKRRRARARKPARSYKRSDGRARAHARAEKRNREISKRIVSFDVINQFSASSRSPPLHLSTRLSFREDTVRPGCEQPFPNWTAFHVESLSHVCVHALPEFSLARHFVVTEGPRYVVYLRRPNTDTHAAVTVSYARVRNPPRAASELLS